MPDQDKSREQLVEELAALRHELHRLQAPLAETGISALQEPDNMADSGGKGRFAAIFEYGPLGMALVHRDARILSANQRLCEITGYSEEELQAISFRDITHPDDRPRDVELLRQITAGEIDSYKREKRYINKNGSVVWVSLTAAILPDQGNAPKYGIAMIEDITERKQTEAALRESEARFRQLADAALEGIGIFDEGRLILANQRLADMMGYEMSEIIGKHVSEFIAPESRELVLHYVQSGYEHPYDHIAMRKDGSLFPAEAHGRAMTTASGRRVRVTAIRDITERKRAEQQAIELALERERAQIMQQFIADVSHDFRTPLSTIYTNIYLMKRTNDESKRQNQMEVLEQEVRRVQRLFDSFIVMARLDDSAELQLQSLNVNSLVEQIAQKIRARVEEKNIQLQSNLATEAPLIWASAEQISLALSNILDNAIQFTPPGGSITLQTAEVHGQALVEIADSGLGIAEADLSRIFERLYKGDKARSQKSGGAGLGLSIAHKIVELHGGRIEVESAPEQGSTFRIFLPHNQLT